MNVGNLSVVIDANANPLVRGVQKGQKSLKGFEQSTKGSTMAVVNFNRIIQDAPFGIIGVANNLEPMIQSFNQLKVSAGSTGGALKTLLKSAFTGPGALITAVSLASSAMVFFTMKMRGAGSQAKETEAELADITKTVDGLVSSFNQLAGFSLSQETEREIQLIDKAIAQLKERERIGDEINNLRQQERAFRQAGTDSALAEARAIDGVIKEKLQEQETITEVVRLYGFEDATLKGLNKEREKSSRILEVLNKTQNQQAQFQNFINETQAEATQTLDRYNAGIEGSADAVLMLRNRLREQINSFRILVNQGNNDVLPVLIALQKEYDRLGKADISLNVKAPDPQPIIEDLSGINSIIQDFYANNPIVAPVKPQLIAPDDVVLDADIMGMSTEQIFNFTPVFDPNDELPDKIDNITNKTEDSAKALQGFGNAIGGAFAQAIVFGDKLEDTLRNLAKQLASRALIAGLGAILTGGASLGGRSLLGNVFGGVFHTGGIVPGSSEKMALVRGGEGIFTPGQMQALTSGGSQTQKVMIGGEFRIAGSDLRLVLEEELYRVSR